MRKLLIALFAAVALVATTASPALALTHQGTYTYWAPPAGLNAYGDIFGISQFIYPGNDPAPTIGQLSPAYFLAHGGRYGPAGAGDTAGFYIGLQKDERGERVIFSVWNAVAAYCGSLPGATCQPFSGEGAGYQTLAPYEWDAGRTYMVKVALDPNSCNQLNGFIMNDQSVYSHVGSIILPGEACNRLKASDRVTSFLEWYRVPDVTSCNQKPYLLVYFYPPTFFHQQGNFTSGLYRGIGYPARGTGECLGQSFPSPTYPPWHEQRQGAWTING